MSFRCKTCETEIASTSQMELDGTEGKVRHLKCPGPPPPPKLKPPSDTFVKLEYTVQASPQASVGEMCVPSKPSTCAVCGDRCIAMCPSCRTLVCQAFGWNGKTCSIAHEGVCAGARASRAIEKNAAKVADKKPSTGGRRNGRHR